MTEDDLPSPSLADDLYFVMHDSVTGQPRLHARLASLGLAGAVLGELMLAGLVTIDFASGRDRLCATGNDAAGDALAERVLRHIVAEPEHSLDIWLEFLARTSYADVRDRMIGANLLKPPTKHLLKKHFAAPVDANTAAWPLARLNLAVQRRTPPSPRDCVLYRLFVAVGGSQSGLWAHDPAFATAITAMLTPPLQRLIVQTEVAVGKLALSRR